MIRSFIDLIFPPLCLACEEKCETKFLCPNCWQLCALPDPVERCRHCFEELEDRKTNLCIQCRARRILPVVRAYVFDPESPARCLGLEAIEAIASFALIQWIQLEWPMPDAIVPMPDSDSLAIGSFFATLLDRPFVRAFRADYSYKEERLEEGQELLLFDISNSMQNLQKAVFTLSESFPKRIYLLSLFPYVHNSF